MALLERVATLIRANLNELVDRAEDPAKMMNQVVLDMENQLLQVKTQVAIAIADQHLLEKKQEENRLKEAEWVRKAEMALERKDEELARVALERSLACRDIGKSFQEQIGDQRIQVENLKSALRSLEVKLGEARAKSDLLRAEHRRARAANVTAEARLGGPQPAGYGALERAKERIAREGALELAKNELLAMDNVEERFAALEKQEEIDRLLAELKAKRQR